MGLEHPNNRIGSEEKASIRGNELDLQTTGRQRSAPGSGMDWVAISGSMVYSGLMGFSSSASQKVRGEKLCRSTHPKYFTKVLLSRRRRHTAGKSKCFFFYKNRNRTKLGI